MPSSPPLTASLTASSEETPPPTYSAATAEVPGGGGLWQLFGATASQLFGAAVSAVPAAGADGGFNVGGGGGAKKKVKASPSCCGQTASRSRVGGAGSQILRIGYDPKRDEHSELVGVIVTVCAGSSYDNLFTAVRQQGADGTRTAVWKVNPAALPEIVAALEAVTAPTSAATTNTSDTPPATAKLATMVEEILSVDPDAVAFNWECCSGCSAAGFGSEAETNAALTAAEYAVSHGHMAMFSDFSLMALIKDWRSDVLGPNPFRQFGSFSGSMELKFDIPTLEACPSAQLQTLGKLAEGGTATVHAMGGTIAYTVTDSRAEDGANAGKYALEVLTVATSFSDDTTIPRDAITRTGAHTGAAGHVVLKYNVGGGTLLTSCGHWIELSKLDTTEEALLRITEQELGEEESRRMRTAFESSATPQMRSELLQSMSSECVQRQSCAMYSPRKK